MIRSVPAATLLVATALVLTVTACGPSNASSLSGGGTVGSGTVATTTPAGTGSTAPGSSVPGSNPAGTSGPPVPAGQIDASAMPGGGPNSVWTGNGDRTIAFAAEQGGCDRLGATLLSETPTEVVVRLTTTSGATPGQMCPMIVRQVVVTVSLAAPLADRTLVLEGTIKHY